MKVRIYYDNGSSYKEIEYCSKFNRINAKGIKDEVRTVMINKIGSNAKNYKILGVERI